MAMRKEKEAMDAFGWDLMKLVTADARVAGVEEPDDERREDFQNGEAKFVVVRKDGVRMEVEVRNLTHRQAERVARRDAALAKDLWMRGAMSVQARVSGVLNKVTFPAGVGFDAKRHAHPTGAHVDVYIAGRSAIGSVNETRKNREAARAFAPKAFEAVKAVFPSAVFHEADPKNDHVHPRIEIRVEAPAQPKEA